MVCDRPIKKSRKIRIYNNLLDSSGSHPIPHSGANTNRHCGERRLMAIMQKLQTPVNRTYYLGKATRLSEPEASDSVGSMVQCSAIA